MVTGGRGVTIGRLLLLGLGFTALAYLGLRIWTVQGGGMPQASWGSLIVLVFMAGGVIFAGLPVRRFLKGRARKPLNPMRAMRTVVLAQASALTGTLVASWYVAQVLVLWPSFDLPSRRSLGWRLLALAVGGVLMVVAGLVVQAMCRVDGDHRDADQERDVDREEHGGSQER
jgi:hypothetical protein